MKTLRTLIGATLALAALTGFGWFFLGQIRGTAPTEGPAGVLLSAPADFVIETLGTMDRAPAAQALSALLARRPGEPKLGVHFHSGAYQLYWLVDRSTAAVPLLIERSAGPGGTRLETQWQGGLSERLAWGAEHGDFEVPGLARGQRKNLYH